MADSEDKTKYILLGCGLALLLGVCGVGSCLTMFGGMAYWTLGRPAQQCKDLLADLREGRLEAAYERMSPAYQKQTDLARFQAAVRARPALIQATDDTLGQRQVVNDTARVGGFLHTPPGDVPVQCDLHTEGGEWRVDALRVAGEPVPPPPTPAPAKE